MIGSGQYLLTDEVTDNRVRSHTTDVFMADWVRSFSNTTDMVTDDRIRTIATQLM